MHGEDQIHVPVKLRRVVELLTPALTGPQAVAEQPHWIVDGTLGMGGHAAALLQAAPGARLLGIDRDREALAIAGRRLGFAADRAVLVHGVFDELPDILREHRIPAVAALMLDLGVSSLQLDAEHRGFAYARDTALDMRMDQSGSVSARDVIDSYSAKELARVFREYGEERFASRIADAIVAARSTGPITSTAELADIVRDSVPAPARRSGGHPAKRVFQALRIEVNDELGVLQRVLPALLSSLAIRGRAVVLSYHSLEDRLVKRAFASAASSHLPPDLPVVATAAPYRLLTRGAEQADDAEIAANPRAASVRLRGIVREAA
jgi:16S rRNA (cytosine1402-N4)-methyltransferase